MSSGLPQHRQSIRPWTAANSSAKLLRWDSASSVLHNIVIHSAAPTPMTVLIAMFTTPNQLSSYPLLAASINSRYAFRHGYAFRLIVDEYRPDDFWGFAGKDPRRGQRLMWRAGCFARLSAAGSSGWTAMPLSTTSGDRCHCHVHTSMRTL